MTKEINSRIVNHEKAIQRVEELSLMEHRFMRVILEDRAACEHVIQVMTQIPDLYMIYISEKDIWGHGETVERVNMVFDKSQKPYQDSSHIIFANTEVQGQGAIADLMAYFKTTDADNMSQGPLSQRVHYIKRGGGLEDMIDKLYDWEIETAKRAKEEGIEQGIEQGREEERQKMTSKLRDEGWSADKIISFTGYPAEKVYAWLVKEE